MRRHTFQASLVVVCAWADMVGRVNITLKANNLKGIYGKLFQLLGILKEVSNVDYKYYVDRHLFYILTIRSLLTKEVARS